MTSGNGFEMICAVLLMWTSHFKTCSSQENTTIEDHYDSSLTLDYREFATPSQENTTTDDYYDSSLTVDYSAYATPCNTSSNRQFRAWFIPIFFAIICFLGLTGNLLVIATFFYFKRLKTMTDVYLLNLSFADLFFAVSLPFWAANSVSNWVFGTVLCKVMHTIYKVSFYSSMLLLSFISMDRYFAINKAVTAHRHRSQAVYVSKVSSVVIWIMALIFSAPEMRYANAFHGNTCALYGSQTDPRRISIQTSQLVLGFVIPLLVMGFCYSAIVKTLCQARSFERNKAIKVIFAVVAVFLVCQVPYNLVLFWATLDAANGNTREDCDHQNNLIFATDVTQCVAFLRCCLNPFVYAFIGVKFRHDMLKLLKHWGCMSQEQFFKYTCGRRRSSAGTETETTTTFSP